VQGQEPDHEKLDAITNERLVALVPDSARTVLQVGSRHGWLAPMLKESQHGRRVYGLESALEPAAGPSTELDGYFVLDLEQELPPLEAGSVDVIVYADALSRLRDPLAVLERQRPLLNASGLVLCSLPNLQHQSVVGNLLRGIFQYSESGLVNPGYFRLFTFASGVELLLDAGFAPEVADRVELPVADDFLTAGAALFEFLGIGTEELRRYLETYCMILRGYPQQAISSVDEVPITFVSCTNDDAQLNANLLQSPCLREPSPHEVLLFRGSESAGDGLNAGIEQAKHDLVVLVHQDVYLPKGWPARMARQWDLARAGGGPIGVAGVFGVRSRKVPFDAVGHVVHRDRLLLHGPLPQDVDGLDELLMIVPRDTPLRIDPALGWHLYGTDVALQAQQRNLRSVVLDAPCHHNSITGRVPSGYRASERVLARKWKGMLPIHTNLSSIDSWLLEGSSGGTRMASDSADDAPDTLGTSSLVSRLRDEIAELSAEIEHARLKVASMHASPFWRARERFMSVAERFRRNR